MHDLEEAPLLVVNGHLVLGRPVRHSIAKCDSGVHAGWAETNSVRHQQTRRSRLLPPTS
jgi:hypothetical protein